MSAHILYVLVLGVLCFDFVLERILEFLNSTKMGKGLPEELKGLYDEEKYQKQQSYEKVNNQFKLITSTFSFVVMICMIVFGGFTFVDDFVFQLFPQNSILQALCFFGILMFASEIINIPFDVYDTFGIETKFGFNTTTVKTYIFDKLKGWLLAAAIGGGLLSLIIWLISTFPTTFWIYAWGIVGFIAVFMAMFYSSLIVPLFNKQTPLEDGELKQAINAFSTKVGFTLQNIFLIDGSKRSTKANAYFSGLGAKKRIVLFDTLVNEMNVSQIVAVLAHEIGHYKKKHVLMMIVFSLIQIGLMFFILGFFVNQPVLSKAIGANRHSIHIALIVFALLYSPLSFIFGIFANILSRKNEFEADTFAAENFDSVQLQDALKQLSVKNLSNLTPHPLYVFFHYSHPPLLERLRNLKKFENKKSANNDN